MTFWIIVGVGLAALIGGLTAGEDHYRHRIEMYGRDDEEG